MNKFLKKSFLILFLSCIFTIQMFAGQNPFLQITEALRLFRDDPSCYEKVEKKLEQIIPAACQIDETKISQPEMTLLVTVFKLDCVVNLKKGKKALDYAKQLEKIISENRIDYEKLSKLIGTGVKFLCINNIAQAYIITNFPEEGIKRLQAALPQFSEGSFEYAMIRFGLGTAFLKMSNFELAKAPLKYAFDYFVKKSMKIYAAIAASNLSAVYLALNDQEKSQYYAKEAMKYGGKNATMVQCELKLTKMVKIWYSENLDVRKKYEFEKARKYILTHSQSDLQIWAAYTFSAIFKSANAYPNTEILDDLEKAYTYRTLIWGEEEVGGNVKEIDELLNSLKDDLLKKLAENKQIESLNYWNARFARSRQKKIELSKLNKSTEQQKMLPLFALVSRYENVRQILAMEESKPVNQRNEKLIHSAVNGKRDIERQFESIKKQLSADEQKLFEKALNDDFIIRPNELRHFSEVIPADTACIQYIPVKDEIIMYLTVKNAPPYVVIIKLKDFKLTAKQFAGKLIKFRGMLQSGAPQHLLQKESQAIYNIFGADLEKSLKRLGIKRLVVNASGILRYIPFCALYDGKQYLIEKYQVSNITGMDLIRLSKNPVKRSFRDIQAVIFADPDGTLPASQKEGMNVAAMFTQKKCYLGKAAALATFEALLGKINFIHLATHAVLDPDKPEFSHIIFADNRKWYYTNMQSLNIKDVDSIVLSACSTAVKPESDGSEIESMAAQLLKNTTSGSIVASFWDIDDGATALFMKNYYQYIIDSIKKTGFLDRGGALQYAQLKLLKNRPTASPKYWAAFALFGDFR